MTLGLAALSAVHTTAFFGHVFILFVLLRATVTFIGKKTAKLVN